MPNNDSDTQIYIRVVCPEDWEQFVSSFVLLTEASCHCGVTDFDLQIPKRITLEIQPSHVIDMEADWSVNQITIGLPFRPSISVWLFSVYFGLAHEVGHLLWHQGPLTLREAWAHYFALEVLRATHTKQLLAHRIDRILLTKDRWLSTGILKLMRYSTNPLERAIANIIHVWRKAGNEQVSTFLHTVEETLEIEDSVLVLTFSQHFGIAEVNCRKWLWEGST